MQQPATLYFDADCDFCQACVSFVKRHDKKNLVTCVALQGSEHDTDGQCYESILFMRDGYQSQYSTAVIDTLKTIGGVWAVMAFFMKLVPRFIRDAMYRYIGRHRYLITGQKDHTCDS